MDSRKRYEQLRERIARTEAEIWEQERLYSSAEQRLYGDLQEFRLLAEEIRAEAVERETRELLEATAESARGELARLEAIPTPTPEDIRRKRKKLGARQSDVAAFAGLYPKTVNRAENGHPCAPMTLKRIADALEQMAV